MTAGQKKGYVSRTLFKLKLSSTKLEHVASVEHQTLQLEAYSLIAGT